VRSMTAVARTAGGGRPAASNSKRGRSSMMGLA
jgi:hypothetical protein